MTELLPFEQEMLLDVRGENSLCISSKGVANDRLLFNLALTYSSSSLLVLVIGAEQEEENSIIFQVSQYRSQEQSHDEIDEETFIPPKRVTFETSGMSNRRELYLKGGVIFITTRILIVDMLQKRIPFESITGIIIMNAQRVLKDCHLAFILRLFRMNNQKGFITALSQNAQSFLGGFAKLERIMRNLFVTKLYLWPRFHASISNTLKEYRAPNVVEMRIYMTTAMKQIQFALIDLISMCLKELSVMNSFIYSVQHDSENSEEENILSTINVISQNLNRIIRANVDSVWFQLSTRARRMLRDIQLLKSLLFHLTELDAVSFYGELKHIRDQVTPECNPPEWLFWTPTETLYNLAQERVFVRNTKDSSDTKQYYNIEINPKLDALNKLLKEIEENENKKIKESEISDDEVIDIIVVLEKRYVIQQIENLKSKGMETVLEELKAKCELLSKKRINLIKKTNDTTSTGVEKNDDEIYDLEDQITLTQMFGQFGENELNIIRKHNRLQLHYYEWSGDRCCGLGLKELLMALHPRYVIIYEPEMSCIRQIEIYQAIYGSIDKPPIDVYFFIFDGSAEEQRYLRNLQLEKGAFERLIQEKSTLAKSKEGDGTIGNHPDLIRGEMSLFHPEEEMQFNSRLGGGLKSITKVRQVLVDLREFRSQLPACIHKLNIELEPVTLQLGDYLLTPDTCVERKSISDLIGSLNSGRLYTQAQVLTRYYKRSILLIEFDEAKAFNFKARFWTAAAQYSSGSFNRPNPLLQLAVLTIQFPLLRLIWSPTPAFSAEIFDLLKQNKEEPDKDRDIISTLNDQHEELPIEYVTDRYDIEVKEFLLSLPGVDMNNVYYIMNRCHSIAHLVECSIEELTEYMSNSRSAKILYDALHKPITVNKIEDKPKVAFPANKKFAYARRKK